MSTAICANSHVYACANDINTICAPLFDTTEISGFAYCRQYGNDHSIILNTTPDYVADMYEHDMVSSSQKLRQCVETNNVDFFHGLSYLLQRYSNPEGYEFGKQRNVDSVISIINQIEEDLEFFVFFSTSGKDLSTYYFDHWHQLLRFKHFFKHAANNLIETAEKTKIARAQNAKPKSERTDYKFDDDTFNQLITPSHYFVQYKKATIKITGREFDTLKCLAQGRTNKETAKILGISPYTLENYREKLKVKFGSADRKQLIDIFYNSELRFL